MSLVLVVQAKRISNVVNNSKLRIMTKQIKKRLEYLREELRQERISYGELAELQSLAEHIDKSDVELLEAAGVPENN